MPNMRNAVCCTTKSQFSYLQFTFEDVHCEGMARNVALEKCPSCGADISDRAASNLYDSHTKLTGLAVNAAGNYSDFSSNYHSADNDFSSNYDKLRTETPEKE